MSAPEYDVRAKDVPTDLFPGGRCRFSLGPGPRRQQEARRRSMDALRRESGAWDVLKAVQAGELTVQEVHRTVVDAGVGAVPELRRRLAAEQRRVPTLEEAADSYLAWYGRQDRRDRSIRLAGAEVRAILRAVPGATRLDHITQENAEAAVRSLMNGGRASKNTQRIRAARLGAIIRHAHQIERERSRKAGRLPAWQPPEIDVTPPPAVVRVRTATRDEALALLSYAAPHQEAYLRAFLHLGFRASELIHTRLGADLDTSEWTWTVQGREDWKPKNKRGWRTLTLPEEPVELRGAISRYFQISPPALYAFRNPRTESRWDINTLARDFYALCDEAGVSWGQKRGGLTLHTLRHTCATNMIRAGVLESVVAAVLGDTIKTVVETYVHLTPDDLADGIRRSESYE